MNIFEAIVRLFVAELFIGCIQPTACGLFNLIKRCYVRFDIQQRRAIEHCWAGILDHADDF